MLVVLPALNEARSVGSVVRDVRGRYPRYDVLVVDDGSTDHTARGRRGPARSSARLPFNLGVGGAMRTGYRYAERNGYHVVVQVDADGQHDPAYIDEARGRPRRTPTSSSAPGSPATGEYAAAFRAGWPCGCCPRALAAGRRPLTDVTSGFRAAGPRCIELFAPTTRRSTSATPSSRW